MYNVQENTRKKLTHPCGSNTLHIKYVTPSSVSIFCVGLPLI